ncbi:toxin-antitoxin system HicB family antitoxin [Cyanothece sp. BG0011]|uniref:toxin-antitoxin system HicB family antitoxin n=1 Tax=Cyanothece sp. BG0011 TaxID=2082950 RepID=UPI000D1EDEEB|nr:toxin-antitoxin system HicB family antitoxin [Cyanothece sp. BG0011]
MNKLTLKLPEILHQKLINLAEKEGVSLNQYIISALTYQVASNYTMIIKSELDKAKQEQQFKDLLVELGQTSTTQIKEILSKRESVKPESELTQEIVNKFETLIQNKSKLTETND